jgi:hypothetical protein
MHDDPSKLLLMDHDRAVVPLGFDHTMERRREGRSFSLGLSHDQREHGFGLTRADEPEQLGGVVEHRRPLPAKSRSMVVGLPMGCLPRV